MSDLHPALDGECCVRCHQPIIDWYVAVPLTPMIDEVVCVPCSVHSEGSLQHADDGPCAERIPGCTNSRRHRHTPIELRGDDQ